MGRVSFGALEFSTSRNLPCASTLAASLARQDLPLLPGKGTIDDLSLPVRPTHRITLRPFQGARYSLRSQSCTAIKIGDVHTVWKQATAVIPGMLPC